VEYLFDDNKSGGLNDEERFVLVASAWLHDIGMAYVIDPDDDIETVRNDHHIRSSKYIRDHRHELSLTEIEAIIIGKICESHCLKDLSSLPETEPIGKHSIRSKLLAACLRIADILDVTPIRAPETVFPLVKGKDATSDEHWGKHLSIAGLSKEDGRLVLAARFQTRKGKAKLEELVASIEQELHLCHKILSKNNVFLNEQVEPRIEETDFDFYNSRFENGLNAKGVLELLTKGIYNRNDIAIREIIQNCFDAYKRRRKETGDDGGSHDIHISRYHCQDGKAYLSVKDSGIGMSANDISEYVAVIAKSINDSEEIRSIFQGTDALISQFGIGLLSCFAISKSVTIRSSREGYLPVEAYIKNATSRFRYSRLSQHDIGTEILLELNDAGKKIDVLKAIKYYIRKATYRLFYGEAEVLPEEDIDDCRIAYQPVDVNMTFSRKECGRDFETADYNGHIGLSDSDDEGIMVLQEGILVTESCKNLVDSPLSIFSGYILLRPKLIDLTASRTEIVQNRKFNKLKEEVTKHAKQLLIDSIRLDVKNKRIHGRKDNRLTERAELYFRLAYDHKYAAAITGLCDNLEFVVHAKDGHKRMPLSKVRPRDKTLYYLQSDKGYVNYFDEFDGVRLYREDDGVTLSKLLKEIYSKMGDPVVEANLYYGSNDRKYSAVELLKLYFGPRRIQIVDLAHIEINDSNHPLPHIAKHVPPRGVSRLLPKDMSCISIPGHSKLCLSYEGEFWLNYDHPSVQKIASKHQLISASPSYSLLLRIYFKLITFKFGAAREEVEALLAMSDVIEKDIDPVTKKQIAEVAKNIGVLGGPGELSKKLSLLQELKSARADLQKLNLEDYLHQNHYELSREFSRLKLIADLHALFEEVRGYDKECDYTNLSERELQYIKDRFLLTKEIISITKSIDGRAMSPYLKLSFSELQELKKRTLLAKDIMSIKRSFDGRAPTERYKNMSREELTVVYRKYKMLYEIANIKSYLETDELTETLIEEDETALLELVERASSVADELNDKIGLIQNSKVCEAISKGLIDAYIARRKAEFLLENKEFFIAYEDESLEGIDDIHAYLDEIQRTHDFLSLRITEIEEEAQKDEGDEEG
jgi:hypothetical protein